MTGPEATIEQYLKESVEGAGGMCIKFKGQKDVPDRVVILNGLTVFVELKAPGAKPRQSQVRMFTAMQIAGAMVFWLDGKDKVDEFIVFMLQDMDEPRIIRLDS